ncbi:MAG: TolC family protein [Desulfobulbaceae bacterium]|nr:TolC family protein [Desulfobulbaceae bacterium]
MKQLWVVFLLFTASLVPITAFPAEDSQSGSQELTAFIAEALENNPELEADEARWEVFINQARQADSLEDPMLMLRAQSLLIRDPVAFDREFMTAKVVGISQKVPFFGKRSLRGEKARQNAEEARWTLEERKVELVRMIKEAWYRLQFIDSSMEIIEKNIAVLDDLNRFSETMYGVGQGLQQDVLKAQVERSRMEEMRISLRQQRRSQEAALNNLRFSPADFSITPASPLALTPLAIDAATLEEMAADNRPLLKGLAAREQKAAAAKQLAEKEFFPDFTFNLEYMQREPVLGGEGYDMYSAGITFNLPVQMERRHAMVAEAGAETRMARSEQDMVLNRIRLDIADSLALLERNLRLAELYREGIIPQADHAMEAAMAAYRVGRADFMNVLDSRMTLFNFEREYIEAVAGHQIQLAVLEAVVGKRLDDSVNSEVSETGQTFP